MFINGVDPKVRILPDSQFFAQVVAILPNFFGYRPRISQDQFFKYGFSEQKMILCIDAINLVRRKENYIKMQ